MRLTHTCTIQMGYAARGRLEPADRGGVPTIQLRDLPPHGLVDPQRLTRVRIDSLPDRWLVRTGDVVFRSRGERNTASALDERFTEPAVAVLPLIILRPQRETILPAYLAWAMNQPPAQRHFDRAARGTNMRMVPRSSLDDLEIDVPGIEIQRKIVAVDALAEREQALSVLAAEKRTRLTRLILGDRARGMGPDAGRREKTT